MKPPARAVRMDTTIHWSVWFGTITASTRHVLAGASDEKPPSTTRRLPAQRMTVSCYAEDTWIGGSEGYPYLAPYRVAADDPHRASR